MGDFAFLEWLVGAPTKAATVRTLTTSIFGRGVGPGRGRPGNKTASSWAFAPRPSAQVVSNIDAPLHLALATPEEKASRWREDIRDALRENRLTHARARTLTGRLAWASSMVFGAAARPYAWPLRLRPSGGGPEPNRKSRTALEWWVDFPECIPERMAPLVPVARRRVIFNTDAVGRRCVDIAARTPAGIAWSAFAVPEIAARGFSGRANVIAAHVLASATSALRLLWAGDEAGLLNFLDYQSAVSALLGGHSKVDGQRAHATQAWRVAAARRQMFAVARAA